MPTKPTGRPRGRPKGSKNIPKIADFVAEALERKVQPKERKPKGPPRGIWARMTPDEATAYALQLTAKRKKIGGGRPKGVPVGMKPEEYANLIKEQTVIVERIIKKMAGNDQLPDDPRAVAALKESMVILRSTNDTKVKLAAARLVLDFTKAKPTSKQEITVKTAEDYLDEINGDA